ncbi:MAG: 2-oxo acid dehydrogenase subunit E2 [Actinobacteria bacterium]|nr:2-oxo acid dehydrogenase subunit E2 [Actinomycetota bacterium]
MIERFLLPDLGEGLPEAEVVQWHVDEGDEVALNQTIAEVETAKAIVEIPSPYAGVVRGLHAAAGDVVEVGAPLVSFEVGGSDATEPASDPARRPAASDPTRPPAESAADTPVEAAAQRRVVPDLRTTDETGDGETRATPNLVGYGAAPSRGDRPRRRPRTGAGTLLDRDAAVHAAAPHDVMPHDAEPLPGGHATGERPRSTPPVRKLAKDLGIDLAEVAATTAPGMVVTREDVEAFAARGNTPSPRAAAAADGRVTRTPIRGVRKHTAAAMVRSAFTAPHATTFLTVDVTATTELLASLTRDRALDGHRIGILAVVAKAACLALGRTPALNARWDEEAGEIVTHHYVHLGIAAATDRGLVVPHVPDADRLALVDLADAIAELTATARAGRTAPAAMTGGTFSITNVGVLGVDAGTPILNPGEAGILAVGAVRRMPWEHEGAIALRDVVTLSLSFDHRLVDGAEAARFLTDVAGVLREPGRAMLLC